MRNDTATLITTALTEQGFAPRSIALYRRTLLRAEECFAAEGYTLDTVPAVALADYVRSLTRSWSTLKTLRAALGHYWTITGRDSPPLACIRVPPKPEMVCQAFEEDDARIMAKAARGRGDLMGFAVLLGLYQGLRREEIATLPWSAFAGDGWMTVTGKGAKRRTIPVHPAVSAAASVLPHDRRFVFPGRFGGACSPATIWDWTRKVATEAGVTGGRTHRLRHTCLATQNDATGDLRTVQAFAGHSRPETTAGYTRATRRRLQAAVAALDY